MSNIPYVELELQMARDGEEARNCTNQNAETIHREGNQKDPICHEGEHFASIEVADKKWSSKVN